MAVLGREAASQAMTSADIVDGAFTLNDLNFTDVPTNLDITGTIDKNTMRLAEGVTVIGDVTISDDLVLAKLSDDGVGITMTTDGTTRTITGSGSIESTTIAQTHSPSLTGMTGTLGNSLKFPAGHILQVVEHEWNDQDSVSGTTYELVTGSSCPITPLDVNSHFLVTLYAVVSGHDSSPAIKVAGTAAADTLTPISSVGADSGGTSFQTTKGGHETGGASSDYMPRFITHSFIHDPALANLNTIYYNMIFANYHNATVKSNKQFATDTGAYTGSSVSSFIIMEIARSS